MFFFFSLSQQHHQLRNDDGGDKQFRRMPFLILMKFCSSNTSHQYKMYYASSSTTATQQLASSSSSSSLSICQEEPKEEHNVAVLIVNVCICRELQQQERQFIRGQAPPKGATSTLHSTSQTLLLQLLASRIVCRSVYDYVTGLLPLPLLLMLVANPIRTQNPR